MNPAASLLAGCMYMCMCESAHQHEEHQQQRARRPEIKTLEVGFLHLGSSNGNTTHVRLGTVKDLCGHRKETTSSNPRREVPGVAHRGGCIRLDVEEASAEGLACVRVIEKLALLLGVVLLGHATNGQQESRGEEEHETGHGRSAD